MTNQLIVDYNISMKKNYDKIMQEEITSFGHKPKLVLHCCCAPCSSAVLERLAEHFDLTMYYYNPNIYPESEYNLRAEEFTKLGVSIIKEEYNHQEFLSIVQGLEEELEGGDRCKVCIEYRMRKTFEFAKKNNYNVVTTTLSISPHKDAEFINMVGERLEKEFGIKYLHADFKKRNGYLRSIEICRAKGIYRQDYCGCEFSLGSSAKE